MSAYSIDDRADVRGTARHENFIAPLLLGMVRRVRLWLQRRAAVAELERLDDRALADIGITRWDFPAILDGTYHRR